MVTVGRRIANPRALLGVLLAVDAGALILLYLAPGMGVAVGVAALLSIATWLFVAPRPQRGILLLAALVPFHGLLLITPLPELAAGWKEVLVLVVAAATLTAPPGARGAMSPLPGWLWPVAVLVAMSVVSAALVGPVQGLVGLKVGFFYLLVFLAVLRCPLSPSERDRLVTILMATGCVCAVVGIIQQVAGAERLEAIGWEYNTTIRATGGLLRSFSTFNQNFPFAMFLMVVTIVGLPVALSDPARRRNRWFLGALPVIAVALAFTVVRGAYLGLAVAFVYLGLRRRLYRPLLLAIPAGLLGLLLLPSGVIATALSPRSGFERVDLWSDALSQLVRHPLGAGLGASGSAAAKVAQVTGSSGSTYQPDNQYFKTLFELGPVGLWLLVVLLLSVFFFVHGAGERLAGTDAAFAHGVAGSVLAIIAICFIATYLEIFPMDVYFWLLLGVVVQLGRTDQARRHAITAGSPGWPMVRSGPSPQGSK